MKGKRRPEYLIGGLAFGLEGIILSVLMIITLASATSSRLSYMDSTGSGIVSRCQEIAGGDSCAADRISNGLYSVSDYLISVFESPDYLVSTTDDEAFARDLAKVVYGDYGEEELSDIMSDLSIYSRMYTIDKTVKGEDRSYRSTGDLSTGKDSSFDGNIVVTENFTSEGRVLMGISSCLGQMTHPGTDIRADILLDGSLCHGYLSTDGSGGFRVSWDTSQARPGDHKMNLIFRADDGRSVAIDGGSIDIPEFGSIANDRVTECVLESGQDSVWYRFNSEDRDAYVNIVGVTGDVQVSLYDLFGEKIGTNDLPGLTNEVLRGRAQDTAEASAKTGIEGISNCFYVNVRRSSGTPDSDSVRFYLVQSKDVARYNGTYMAVLSDNGSTYRLVDGDSNLFEANHSDVEILALNGSLCDITMTDATSGDLIPLWPSFEPDKTEYAFYMPEEKPVKLSSVSREGYAAHVSMSGPGMGSEDEQGFTDFDLNGGMNEIAISVESFSGETKEYMIYVLCGDDGSGFVRDTLSQFPESYYSGLILLHYQHPDYVFTAYDTGLKFNEAVEVEDSGGRSLATYTYDPTLVKPDSKVYDAPDWMAVKPEVIRYFMDPRNFLRTDRIFMFERQSFNPRYHTRDGIRSMISGTFMDTTDYDYVEAIYNAAETSGVSPYLLASRILQEMGNYGQSDLARGTVSGYEGYYNFYNIGSYASTSAGGPVLNGARYARWGNDPDSQEITDKEASYLLPWDSIDKAITGGALWIANGYINNGQDTLYFQKFDVVDNGTTRYDHQYAGYIKMAYSEGYRYYKSYMRTGQLENSFEFIIPVYDNMPEEYGFLP